MVLFTVFVDVGAVAVGLHCVFGGTDRKQQPSSHDMNLGVQRFVADVALQVLEGALSFVEPKIAFSSVEIGFRDLLLNGSIFVLRDAAVSLAQILHEIECVAKVAQCFLILIHARFDQRLQVEVLKHVIVGLVDGVIDVLFGLLISAEGVVEH